MDAFPFGPPALTESQEVMVTIGAQVKALREGRDLTQGQLAEICECQRTAIVRVESQHNPLPSIALSTLVTVAAGLGAKVEVRLV